MTEGWLAGCFTLFFTRPPRSAHPNHAVSLSLKRAPKSRLVSRVFFAWLGQVLERYKRGRFAVRAHSGVRPRTVPLLFPTLWKDLCVRGPWVAAHLTASESTRAQVRPPQGQDYCPKSALGHWALQHTRADRPGP
jgi:hypothetical protein